MECSNMDLFKTYRSEFGALKAAEQALAETGLKFEAVELDGQWVIEPVYEKAEVEASESVGLVSAVRDFASRMGRRYNWHMLVNVTNEQLEQAIPADIKFEQALLIVYGVFLRQYGRRAV